MWNCTKKHDCMKQIYLNEYITISRYLGRFIIWVMKIWHCDLTLSFRRPFHIETSPLICHRFLYDNGLRHEKVMHCFSSIYQLKSWIINSHQYCVRCLTRISKFSYINITSFPWIKTVNCCFDKLCKIQKKTPVPESSF